jgi:hypothetical protein
VAAGRLVQTFQALGVGADTATGAMFKLSKAIETSPKKLEDLGVVIAHNAAGNVDLSKTLLSVADAYNATGDQVKKNMIVFDAFGKSGKDMIPILEQGSVALQNLEASARLTFTDADLQRLKDTKIAQAEAKQGWESWVASMGEKAIPAFGGLWNSLNRGTYVTQRLNEAVAAGTISQDELTFSNVRYSQKVVDLTAKYDAQFEAQHKVTHALNEQAAAMADATAKADALSSELDKLIGLEETAASASIALQRADLAVAESQGKVDVASQNLTDAIAKYGAGSAEAKLATEHLTGVYLDQQAAYAADAAAARKLQEATDLVTLGHKDAALEAKAYIDKLQSEADALAPGSPLRVNLEAYIKKLRDEIPRDITTTVHIQGTNASLPSYEQGPRAVGGPVAAGGVYTVGEQGPEIFVPKVAGTIIPHGQAAGAGSTTHNNYNLTLAGTSVVNDPDGVRRMLQRMEFLGSAI